MRRIHSTFAVLALALFGLASCDSGSSTSPGTGGVSAPSFSPAGGTFSSAQSVTLTSSTSGTAIFYTTDGATPTITSTPYVQPISVTSSETIKAIAIGAGAVSSSVSSATYTIQAAPGAPSAPTFSLAPGSYTYAQTVIISTTSADANIYYSTDGTVPTSASTRYTAPVSVGKSMTLTAVAVKGAATSLVSTATYVVGADPINHDQALVGTWKLLNDDTVGTYIYRTTVTLAFSVDGTMSLADSWTSNDPSFPSGQDPQSYGDWTTSNGHVTINIGGGLTESYSINGSDLTFNGEHYTKQ